MGLRHPAGHVRRPAAAHVNHQVTDQEGNTTVTMTYGEALALANVSIPEHLEAGAAVPVLTGPQAQGDLIIIPVAQAYGPPNGPRGFVPDWPQGSPVPLEGVQVIHGEATGNTHWLHAGFNSPGVTWHRADAGLVIGVVRVPKDQTAVLVHTDEHGANGIGPGTYEIRQKREQADEVRYVAD